ncbi:MAG: aminotransferase class III-fold pyridoxal phosphate-dependent enzyme [Gammaproteobacteria bacterium]|nr:aminotransferase class III-fold pyridoxal phosphate-dependent enzyme [Gammaproteobacteria bacterium]
MSYNAKQAEQAHLLQVYAQADFEPVSASDITITCRDGRQLLDFYGGHAVASLGYAHPDAVAALSRQAEQLFFQSNAVPLEARAQVGDKLAAFSGMDRVFLCNSGAEANENALRIALRATGRTKVLALEHGFHGRTAAAGAVTWKADKWYGFPQKPFDVGFVPRDDADAAVAQIDASVAAVILEPVQGIAGAYALDAGFVAAVAAACKQHGVLLIADEVQSGVGRCGAPFAIHWYGVQPDILTTAKALGGGFPVGAVMMTEAVAAVLSKGDLGTTFGGAPLACALINTVLDVIERDQLIDNVKTLSARIWSECMTGPVTAISGSGFLLGLRCAGGAAPVRSKLLEAGILTGSSNDPDVMRLLPPLTLGHEHVDALVAALKNIQ